ncbi:polysaccharide pyruvyl transferase family protein [Candidatus Woesearchaeota archaeon]|nr:polysaccharide pyruvyl transferase family protein [Candidatus Woesearchaeota archaeon]
MKKEDKVLIFGYYGMSNVGSEARLQVIVDDVRKANPSARIYVAGFNYYKEERLKDVNYVHLRSVSPFAIRRFILSLKKYDYIINGEGIPYVDFCGKGFLTFFLPILYWAKAFGKKTASYSFDIDRMTRMDSWFTKRVLDMTDLLVVRSPSSVRELKRIGVHHRTCLTADCAYLFKGMPKEKLSRRLKGLTKKNAKKRVSVAVKDFFCYPVSLRFFGNRDDIYQYPYYYTYANNGKERYRKFVDEFAAFVDRLVEEHDAEVFLVVMEHMMDYRINKAVHDRLKNKDVVKIVSGKDFTVSEIKTILSSSDMTISARLHALILSLDSYIPLIGMSSDERFKYFFSQVRLKEYCIDAADPRFFTKLSKLVERGFRRKKSISRTLRKQARELKSLAKQNSAILKDFFQKP